jgi:hypothetical protein
MLNKYKSYLFTNIDQHDYLLKISNLRYKSKKIFTSKEIVLPK